MFQMPREALPGGGGGQGDREYSESEEEVEEEVLLSGVEKAQLVLAAQRAAWKEQEEYHRLMLEKVMPPPETPLEVILEGVSLDVTSEVPGKTFFSRSRKITRTILKDINISVHPGELLAIMGPTGCGKSTLLNTIAGRAQGKPTGNISFNGHPRTKSLRRQISYVLQDDILFPMLTVEETLNYSAQLKLPGKMPRKEKLEKVQQMIDLLGLTKCKTTIVGDARVRGVSGGERKRTNIGNEIVTGPSMLLLDEPTSGLDSSTAESILSLLNQYAKGGRTVITTIHQPSSRIFEMFDKLLLMCDGSIVYYGPAKDALDYFAALGYECPPNYNPADFLLGLLSVSTATLPTSSLSPSPSPTKSGGKKSSAREHLISSYAQYSSKKEDIESGGERRGQRKSELPAPSKGSDYPASWFQQFLILLHRSLVLQKPKIFDKIPLIQILSVAIIIGLLWLRVDKTEERIQDRLAIVFFIAIFAGGFVPLLSAVFSIPLDRAVVGKERASKAYNISAYFIAKNISELPLQFAYPTIFVCITYWMIGLNSDPGRFFTYLGLILLSNFTSASLGLLAGALFLDITVATLAASVLTLSMMLVGGFFLHLSFLGWWIRWTQYLSFLRYLYYALLTNELSGNIHFKQQKDVISPYDGYDPIYGKDVLKVLGISDEPLDVWSYALVILGFAILFRTLAFLAVRYLHQPPNK